MNDPFEPGLLSRLPDPPQKIAVLRASRIGDFTCATPAFRALRAALPEAEITIITLPMLKDLAVRSPHFDRFAAFPGFPGIAEQFFEARRAANFFQTMQAKNFDLAIQLQGSGVYSNPFTLLLGAKAAAGYIRPGDSPGLLDAVLPIPEDGHEIHRVLALIEFLGASPQGDSLDFPLWQADIEEAGRRLRGAKPPLIGLHPFSRQKTRQWPMERFAAAARLIWQAHGGTVIGLGEQADRQAMAQVLQEVEGPALNLAGRTTLGGLGAVIDRLAVLLTNDSGPAHIAYARGAPTVVIFGSDTPLRYGPLQPGPFRVLAHPVECRPCEHSECPVGYTCLEGISVEMVVEAANEIIKAND